MTLFLSTFINKLDKKGRVSVPASFRQRIVDQSFQGIVVFCSYKLPTLEGMGIERMERLSQSVDTLDVFSESQDPLTTALFSDTHMLAFDGDGRILLPRPLLDHAQITDMVAFVGRGATFRLWKPELFEEHQNQTRQLMRDREAPSHA